MTNIIESMKNVKEFCGERGYNSCGDCPINNNDFQCEKTNPSEWEIEEPPPPPTTKEIMKKFDELRDDIKKWVEKP